MILPVDFGLKFTSWGEVCCAWPVVVKFCIFYIDIEQRECDELDVWNVNERK